MSEDTVGAVWLTGEGAFTEETGTDGERGKALASLLFVRLVECVHGFLFVVFVFLYVGVARRLGRQLGANGLQLLIEGSFADVSRAKEEVVNSVIKPQS